MTRRKLLNPFYLITLLAFFHFARFADASFEKKRIQDHVRTLASPDFQGRSPLTDGEIQTTSYLTQQFKKLKLSHLPGKSSYLNPVPLAVIQSQIQSPIRFGNLELALGQDIAVQSSYSTPSVSLKNAEVVFVGYGISDPARGWNDFEKVDVKGKVIITWVNDPGFRNPTLFRGKNMTYFGRWTYKLEEARRRGAIGAFIIHEEAAAGYGWNVPSAYADEYLIHSSNQNGENPPLQVHGWIKESSVRKIFAHSNLNYDLIKTKELKPGNVTSSLSRSSLSLQLSNRVTLGNSNNVCGILPGKDPKSGYILLSAHWDHLGKMVTNEKTEVFAGAIDNASGVAALLELGREFQKHRPLHHSLIFCSFTAEERGLLGAKYFVSHPPIPLSQIRGMLNFDSLNMGEVNPNVVLSGGPDGKLGEVLKKVAKRKNRTVIDDPVSEKGYFYRSDHLPFVLASVKALNFLDIGFTDPNYLTHHYHQASDTYQNTWSLNGFIDDLELFKGLVLQLDATKENL